MLEITLDAVKEFCKNSSGSPFIWQGRTATYKWNIGKTTKQGILNGVVRKLAAFDANGEQIWVVAGSIKILPDGTIARFTGLPKQVQKTMYTEKVEV